MTHRTGDGGQESWNGVRRVFWLVVGELSSGISMDIVVSARESGYPGVQRKQSAAVSSSSRRWCVWLGHGDPSVAVFSHVPRPRSKLFKPDLPVLRDRDVVLRSTAGAFED